MRNEQCAKSENTHMIRHVLRSRDSFVVSLLHEIYTKNIELLLTNLSFCTIPSISLSLPPSVCLVYAPMHVLLTYLEFL